MIKRVKLYINKPKLKIRLANIQDLKFTFNLYNRNVIEKNFFTLKKISFVNHKKWFEKKIKEKMFYICTLKEKIGYVRFDRIKTKNVSVSIAIKKKYHRKGYGKNMLVKVLNKKKIYHQNVWAIVKNKNLTSKKFFIKIGFIDKGNNKFMKKALQK